MTTAIYYGLLGIPRASVSAAASCPLGECTWHAYDTLAVCSLCKNVTAKYLKEAYSVLIPSVHISPSTNRAPPTTNFFNARIYYPEPVVSKRDRDFREIEPQAGQTYDCSLFWCIRSFSSANMTGGILVENPRNSSNLTYIGEDRVRIVTNGINSTQPPPGDNVSSFASNRSNFMVDESNSQNLFHNVYQLLEAFFSHSTSERIDNYPSLTDSTPIFKTIANAISAQLRTIPFSSPSSSSSSNSLPNTTTAITRTFVAPGTAFNQEPVLVVQRTWLAIPVFLLFATAFFLFLVILLPELQFGRIRSGHLFSCLSRDKAR